MAEWDLEHNMFGAHKKEKLDLVEDKHNTIDLRGMLRKWTLILNLDFMSNLWPFNRVRITLTDNKNLTR